MNIAYCQNPRCERIFSGQEIAGIDLFAPDAKLPCGHAPSQLVLAASVLRDAKHKADRYDKLVEFLRDNYLGDDICDACDHTGDCGEDPFGDKCPKFSS